MNSKKIKQQVSPKIRKLLSRAVTKPFPSKQEMVQRVVEEARKASEARYN